MRGVKARAIALFALLLAAALALGYFFVYPLLFPRTAAGVFVPPPPRFNIEEILLAAALQAHDVTMLEDMAAGSPTVFLTFNGLSDKKTMRQILDLLDAHNIQASFFLPGLASAENSDIVEEIALRGHHIGNYSLKARPQMETLSPEAIAQDFYLSKIILAEIVGFMPAIVKGRSTVYTQAVRQGALAAGARYILDARHYLSFQSLQSFEQVKDYVAGLEWGVVLSIVVDRVLDEKEFTGVQTSPASLYPASLSPEDKNRLVQMVAYLLEAFAQEGFAVLPVPDMLGFLEGSGGTF